MTSPNVSPRARRNHWTPLIAVHPELQKAFDWACDQFPEGISQSGVARIYYGALWQCREVLHATSGDLEGVRVLDVGSGAGLQALTFRALGATVTCVDQLVEYDDTNIMGSLDGIASRLSANDIELMKRNIVTDGLGVEDGSYDVITCFEVIEHLHQAPRDLFEAIRRALKPRGVAVISTPNHGWLRTRLRLLSGRTAHYDLAAWWDQPYYGHIREYTLGELCGMMEWSGLEIQRRSYGNWYHLSNRTFNGGAGYEEWTTRRRLADPRSWVKLVSLLATAVYPAIRFDMCVTGRKSD